MAGGLPSRPCSQGHSCSYVALLLLVLSGHTGRCFPAAELKGDSSSVCKAGEVMPALGKSFTVCVFLRHSHDDGRPKEKQRVDEEDGEDLDQDQDYTFFSLNQSGIVIRASVASSHVKVHYNNTIYTVGKVPAGAWRRFCLSRDPDSDRVVAYIRDRVSVREEAGRRNTAARVEVPGGVCLGSSSQGHKSLSGIVTAFSIQPQSRRPHQDRQPEPTDCSALVPSGALLTLDASWNSTGNVHILEYNAAQFCSEAFTSLFLKYKIGRRPQFYACKSLGGRFLSKGEVESAAVNFNQALRSSCFADGKYVAWIAMNTNQTPLPSMCDVLLVNGSLANSPCISELPCFLCLVPVDLRFKIFGRVRAHDATYTLKATANEDLYLEGVDFSKIERVDNQWVLQSRLHSESWNLTGAPLPVGRHVWQFHDKSENLKVTVTACSLDEFSCDEGNCVPREQRCDGIGHCKDGSDEKSCEILKMTESYDKAINPCSKKTYCTIGYDIAVHFMSEITTEEDQATLEISMRLTWFDDRLTFLNLKSPEQNFECEMIWLPTLIALAGYLEGQVSDLVPLSRTCGVNHSHTDDNKRDFFDPMMNTYFLGSKNPLYYIINFRLTVRCNFRLERYPFGSHVCQVSFYFKEKQPNIVFEKRPLSILNYTGSHDLLQFRLKKVTFETVHETPGHVVHSFVILSLHLQTLYEYHVLNSFAPSALMFFIVFSTLFYPISNFNERIMVSLTALLVLAALFTQASSSSVKTPYYKLLDVWYAALILLCFIVVIINAVVHSLMQTKGGPVKVSPMLGQIGFDLRESGARRAALCNLVSKIIVIILFLSLVIVYVLCSFDMI